jgi:proline iminopeptidase
VETFVHSGDVELWVADEGEGPPVVLISGGPGCCDYLGPVAGLLRPGYRTVRFDARGCGRSSPTSDFTVANSIADLDSIREQLGFDSWVLLGHSAGCEVALAYAVRHPQRTRALALLAGGRIVDDRQWHAIYAAGRDAGRESQLDFAYPPNMEANRALNADWKTYIHRPQLLREMSAIAAPALFVEASEDIRPSWPAQQLAQLLPHARFASITGADHHLWLTHADALGDLLRGFLDTV